MEFSGLEWDENKRVSNLEKHGLDFMDAAEVLEGSLLLRAAETVAGEERWMGIGILADVRIALIFIWRRSVIRVISMRWADREERRNFDQSFGR